MASLPVAYAGEPGAFAEDAVIALYGEAAPRLPVGGFRQVFEAVTSEASSAGVVPIENLVNGSVREVYDLLLEHELVITGEVVVPVELCLAALPGRKLEDIERVYSHLQALGQAERFLRTRPWALLTTYNTAGAGRFIKEQGDGAAAAVLSRRAATELGLEVLVDGIQDVVDNRTRFLVIGRTGEAHGVDEGAAYRSTIAFGVRNEPGTLLAALQVFAARAINLSKLESRPSREAAWEYVFWADLDAHAEAPEAAAALDQLGSVATMVRVLGTYPKAAS